MSLPRIGSSIPQRCKRCEAYSNEVYELNKQLEAATKIIYDLIVNKRPLTEKEIAYAQTLKPNKPNV